MGRKAGVSANTINIDKKALKQYLKVHGYSLIKVSEELGYSTNYLSDVLQTNSKKKVPLPVYKYLCAMIKVTEDKFILKEEPKPVVEPKKESATSTVINQSAFTPEQFNALLQAISNLGDTINKALEKLSNAENSTAVIQGKIYGEVMGISTALGVKEEPKTTIPKEVHVKPQYANGGKH